MAQDVSSLKTSVGTIQTDVGDLKKDMKDTLNRALDRAYGAIPRADSPPKKKALLMGNEAIQIANDLQS